MSSYTEDSPYPSAHGPSEIAAYLRKGTPVVPAGPYYIYDDTRVNPPPQRLCDLDMLAEEVSRWEERCGKAISLAPVSRNVVTYISAGLLKHCAFAVWSQDRDLMIEFATLRLSAEDSIKEAFKFNGTVTHAHMQWIALEQARCISVAIEYPELLKESSRANTSMLKAIKAREVRSRRLESRDRINALEWLISTLCYSYIDLTVYARRSDQLNTLGQRFRLTAGQLKDKQYTLDDLQRRLSRECKTVFKTNEQLFEDVQT
ncbi:hypothetical protein MMC30_006404 [Trapelia coarctata]|nr:hypothetical protein [Trapelia coarctata]